MTDLYFPVWVSGPVWRGRERTATPGVLARWVVVDGGQVSVGDRVAEVRAADPAGGGARGWISALATGTLWHQVEPGEVVAPGALVGLIE